MVRAPSRWLAHATLLLTIAATAVWGTPDRAVAQGLEDPVLPGDSVPEFTLNTLDGQSLALGGVPSGDGPDPDAETVMFLVKHPDTTFSQSMWSADVAHVFEYSPPSTRWVFASYAADEETRRADVTAIRDRISAVLEGMDEQERAGWADRFAYVIDHPAEQPAAADMLLHWGSDVSHVAAEWAEGQIDETGAADTGWAPSLREVGPIEGRMAWYGLACADEEPEQDLAERIALIERGNCTFTEKVANAESRGAVATVLFTDDRPVIPMGGDAEAGIPTMMIAREPGTDVRDALLAGQTVTATLSAERAGVEAMGIDHAGRAQEFGTIPFPWGDFGIFRALSYEAQYMHFEHQRALRLADEAEEYAVLEVPVFEEEWASDPGWAGQRSYAEVTLPDASVMSGFDTLEVDLSLSCPDHWKGNCPAWDYLVHMYLCDAEDPESCGQEIGRWITPYWSGGRWVHDISHVLADMYRGGTRRIAFYTQQRYQVDATFRLSNRAKGSAPREMWPLFTGGRFNLEYNDKYEPYEFRIPWWAERVELVALITGHGYGDDHANCAEFCNHTHHFTVNDTPEIVKEHPTAGTEFGCANRVSEGVVPNQGGTWIYGRAGWCPGQEVTPWVTDITDRLDMEGGVNRITYRGLFQGADFDPQPVADPTDFPARIDMNSYLIIHGPYDSDPSQVVMPWLAREAQPTALADMLLGALSGR